MAARAVPDNHGVPASGALRRDLGKGFDELPKLAQLFPPSDDLGRRVQDAVRRYTLQELPRWRNDLEGDWQLVRNRVVRVRNTLARGGPLMDDTVMTVHEFIEQLAQWSLEVALEGLLGGQNVATANRHKQECDQWNDGLASAATVIDALTG